MNISKVSGFSILPYSQNRKLGNLGNMSLTSNSDSSYNSRFKNHKNMNWAENWKVPIWFKRKNKNFRDFQVFDFALYPKLKTRKSRKFCLSRILTLIVTQDLKTPKKWTETKTKRFRYDLEQQQKVSENSKFSILPYTKNRKLGNLGNFSFTSNFDSTCNLRCKKKKKKMIWDKI